MSEQNNDALAAVAMRIEANTLYSDIDRAWDVDTVDDDALDVHPGSFDRTPVPGRVTMHDVVDRHGVRWQTAVDAGGRVIASTPIDDLGVSVGPRS